MTMYEKIFTPAKVLYRQNEHSGTLVNLIELAWMADSWAEELEGKEISPAQAEREYGQKFADYLNAQEHVGHPCEWTAADGLVVSHGLENDINEFKKKLAEQPSLSHCTDPTSSPMDHTSSSTFGSWPSRSEPSENSTFDNQPASAPANE